MVAVTKNRKLAGRIVSHGPYPGTASAFASLVGADAAKVSRVINGKQDLPFWEQKLWANALGATVEEIFEDDAMTDEKFTAEVKKKWDSNPAIRAEFRDDFNSFLAYSVAQARGLVGVISGRCPSASGVGK